MRTAGGVLGSVAGVCGVLAALLTLGIGGVGSAASAFNATRIVGQGWGGLALSAVAVGLGAWCLRARGPVPGLLLVACGAAGAFLGGKFVAACMVVAIGGGLLSAGAWARDRDARAGRR